MSYQRVGIAALAVLGFFAGCVFGQDIPGFDTREAANAYYAKKSDELHREHLAALEKVASKEEGEAADATYRLLFNLAIARGSYDAVEKAAEAVIARGNHSLDVEILAHFVNAISEANRGEVEKSLAHLEEFIEIHKPKQDLKGKVDPRTVVAMGEAYFQRLAQLGRYDVAARLCKGIVENASNPGVIDHFRNRLARVEMLGKPAPDIVGKDIDGHDVRLSDLKGKVVLVDFWATWCPPCSDQMLRLNALREMFGEKGFEVLGVNVDGLRQDAGSMDSVRSAVRRYVIAHQAAFPIVVCAPGDATVVQAYGVTDIPANFLIGRDGKLVQFELSDMNFVKGIEAALGANQ